MHVILTIIPRVCVGYEMVDSQRGAVGYNHHISNKREGKLSYKKRPGNIENSFRLYLQKTTDFQLVFNFKWTHTVTIFGEHVILAHIP